MLNKITVFCLFSGLLMAQGNGKDKDCVKLENDTKITVLKFSIGDGGCALKNINYPVMAERLRPAEGFVYVTVFPKEVGENGKSPKFVVRSGEETLAQLVLNNVSTWGIKKDSVEFQIIFQFTVKRKNGAWDCASGPKPSIRMWVSPAGSIMVNIESKIDCLVFF